MSSNQSPLITIVVPAYNRADLIGETITTVLEQTYENWELLVIDDGSTDDTKGAVQRAGKGDKRVRCIRQNNAERAVARNRGIRDAQGEYIAFLDSDDLWLPEKLQRQIAALNSTGADCCFCLYSILNSQSSEAFSSQISDEDIFISLLKANFIGSMTPLIRRQCLLEVAGFNEDRRIIGIEDWELWTRLSIKFSWICVPEVLASYRQHPGNSYQGTSLEMDLARMDAIGSYKLSPHRLDCAKQTISERAWYWAKELQISRPSFSMHLLLRCAKNTPTIVFRLAFWNLAARCLKRSLGSNPGN